MDPMALAGSAVALLVPYLERVAGRVVGQVGQDLDQAVMGVVERIYAAIKSRVGVDGFAEGALERLEQQPVDQRRQATVQDVVAELIDDDSAFRTLLTELVEEAKAAGGTSIAQIAESGAAAVGGNVTMTGTHVAGRDMTIGGDHRDDTRP
jgi:hypothetical protein